MASQKKKASPRILSLSWGRIDVEGLGLEKDVKLWPGGGTSWNWADTGTGHSPGIQISDCEELVANGCEVVVLSRGMLKRLKIMQETLDFLENNNIETIVAGTKKAVNIYNTRAAEGRPVGGLFHSTC